MKQIVCSSLLALLLSTPAFADNGGFKCNPEGNQQEMNVCAAEDYAKADKQLNKTWKALMKKEKANKLYIKKIRASQRIWIKFRDAEVAAVFACAEGDARACWGSMYPLLYHGEMATITEERTKQLQKYIDDGRY